MAITPQTIAKAAINEMVTLGKKPEYANTKMIALWEDAFPIIAYLDDADLVKARRASATKSTAKPTATDMLRADISIGELWGEDINDNSTYAGLAMEAAASEAKEMGIEPIELHAHLAEGLTRSQLARTGFKEHGGLVLTMLNPMLAEYEARVRVGSHMFFRAQRYHIAETTDIVKWEGSKGGHLYKIVNMLIG